ERYEVRDSASFLVRTVTRLSMNDCRDRQRHPYDPRPVEELDGITPLIDASPLPEEIANQQQQWKLIEEVFDTVDERTLNALIRDRIHRLAYAESSQQLGVRASTVEKDITSVMARLIGASQDCADSPCSIHLEQLAATPVFRAPHGSLGLANRTGLPE